MRHVVSGDEKNSVIMYKSRKEAVSFLCFGLELLSIFRLEQTQMIKKFIGCKENNSFISGSI